MHGIIYALTTLFIFIISFSVIYWSMPKIIKRLVGSKRVAKDMYKNGLPHIPTEGGIALLFVCFLMVSIFPLLFQIFNRIFDIYIDISGITEVRPKFEVINYFAIMVISTYGIMGIMDDYINIGRKLKVLMPPLFAIPLILNIDPNYLIIPFYGRYDISSDIYLGSILIKQSWFYRYLVIPLYILVVTNLINMHSGFNGLQTGMSAIILVGLVIKAFINSEIGISFSIVAVAGGTLAIWFYNKYPARIFEGNSGSMVIGSSIGVMIILTGFLISGFVMLIPHTVNFLLYVYWRIKHAREPYNLKYRIEKFGRTKQDGTLSVPNPFTLKWIIPYYRPVNEWTATKYMYALTGVFVIIGILLPFP